MPWLPTIRRLFGWLTGRRRSARSAHWPALRRQWLQAHPACAACGATRGLEVHHIVPVSWDAGLELEWSNLITLCAVHHLWTGHLGDWRARNPDVVLDAHYLLSQIVQRPYPPGEFA